MYVWSQTSFLRWQRLLLEWFLGKYKFEYNIPLYESCLTLLYFLQGKEKLSTTPFLCCFLNLWPLILFWRDFMWGMTFSGSFPFILFAKILPKFSPAYLPCPLNTLIGLHSASKHFIFLGNNNINGATLKWNCSCHARRTALCILYLKHLKC